MNHQKAIYLIEGFEPGELTPGERESLQRHLAACASCTEQSANTAPLRGFFAQAASLEPDGLDAAIESVRQGTLRAIRAESVRAVPVLAWVRSFLRVPVLVPVGAAALVLMAVVVRMPGRTEGVARQNATEPVQSARLTAAPAALEAPAPVTDLGSEEASSPAPVSTTARRSGSRRSEGPNSEFVMLHNGSDVTIQWLHDGGDHRIRKGQSPVSVQAAGRRVVRGDVWSDPEAVPAPGTITYYLVD